MLTAHAAIILRTLLRNYSYPQYLILRDGLEITPSTEGVLSTKLLKELTCQLPNRPEYHSMIFSTLYMKFHLMIEELPLADQLGLLEFLSKSQDMTEQLITVFDNLAIPAYLRSTRAHANLNSTKDAAQDPVKKANPAASPSPMDI